jgi:hypothetical protein
MTGGHAGPRKFRVIRVTAPLREFLGRMARGGRPQPVPIEVVADGLTEAEAERLRAEAEARTGEQHCVIPAADDTVTLPDPPPPGAGLPPGPA